MKKSELEAIRGNLSKVVEPYSPSRRDKTKSLISAYDDGSELYSKEAEALALSRAMPAPGSAAETVENTSITTPPPRPAPGARPASPAPPPAPLPENLAPAKDFNKRANSLEREALPAGLFPASSKKLYDALYYRTRGSINPRSTIQATRNDLMNWSGLRNRKTIEAQMKYLLSTGLIHRTVRNGDKSGIFYEVKLPEEVGLNVNSTLTRTRTRTRTKKDQDQDQKMVPDQDQKMVLVRVANPLIEETFTEPPKTFLKTKINTDDEAFAVLTKKFRTLTEKFTGKFPSPDERELWGEVADALVAEFNEAARHTNAVSSVPAFLAAHLQRRFARPSQKKAPTVKKDEVGRVSPKTLSRVMTDEERGEVIRMIVEMVISGDCTLEQAERQFGGSLRAKDWLQVKSALGIGI